MAIGKSKPKLGMYEEQQDTPWITRNRELNETSYNNLSRDLNNVNVFDDATKQQLNAYNDSIYNRSVSDFDRDYAQTMNKYLSRDYNRFGTTGGTSSLLNRDNYNLAQQRKLADMEYNRAMNYEDMVNQELSRRYSWLSMNNSLFNTSGTTTQNFDNENWKIRNQNVDRRYQNDLQSYNSKAGLGRTAITALGAALAPVTGGASMLIAPAIAGMVSADAGNLLQGQTGSNVDSGINSLGSAMGYIGGQQGWDYYTDYVNQLRGDRTSSNNSNNITNQLAQLIYNLQTTGRINNPVGDFGYNTSGLAIG